MLDLQRCGEQPCERVTGILDAQIAEIDQRLTDLRRSQLAARRAARRGGHDTAVCRIIENAPAESVRA